VEIVIEKDNIRQRTTKAAQITLRKRFIIAIEYLAVGGAGIGLKEASFLR